MGWNKDRQKGLWEIWETKLFSFNPMALTNPDVTDDEWLEALADTDRDLYEPHIYTPRLILIWLDHFPKDLAITKKRLAQNGMLNIYRNRDTLRQTTTTQQDIVKHMLEEKYKPS